MRKFFTIFPLKLDKKKINYLAKKPSKTIERIFFIAKKNFSGNPYLKKDVYKKKFDDNLLNENIEKENSIANSENEYNLKFEEFKKIGIDKMNDLNLNFSNNQYLKEGLNKMKEGFYTIKDKVDLNLTFNSQIEEDDIDYSELFSKFSSLHEFDSYIEKNKPYLINDPEKLLLLLDYLTQFKLNKLKLTIITNDNIEEKFKFVVIIEKIISLLEDKLLSMDPFLIISFIESLYKCRYYSTNKIWIKLEYILLRTNILRSLSLDLYFIILKAYEYFFNRDDSTILADEIFELVEYNCILNFKDPENQLIFKKIQENFKSFEYNFYSSIDIFKKENVLICINEDNNYSKGLLISQKVFVYEKIFYIDETNREIYVFNQFILLENENLRKFFSICELYYSFSKNIEGSRDFYKLFLDKFFIIENLQIFKNVSFAFKICQKESLNQQRSKFCRIEIINKQLFECLVNLYFCNILIFDNVCNKNFISEFLMNIEKIIIEIFKNLERNLRNMMKNGLLNSFDNNNGYLCLKISGGEYQVENCNYFIQERDFFLIPYNNHFINDETRNILIWCLSKRNLFNNQEYLINFLHH